MKNDILRLAVIITGSDGYTSVFGAGEIAPGFGGDQIVIAYAQDGLPLGSDGFAKIVAPGDKMGGRFVSNIVKIEVRNLALPTIQPRIRRHEARAVLDCRSCGTCERGV